MKYLNHRLGNFYPKHTFHHQSTILSKSCLAGVLLAAGSLAITSQGQAQTTIAHWSFDSSTLSYDLGGNIAGTSDVTGNHDMTVGSNVGSGTGSPYTSATFASSDSVSGAFGQGLMFNGNNFMVFNNLTELMASSGAPSYTISLWFNVAAGVPTGNGNGQFGGATPYETLSDWGNAAAGTGTSRYAYVFGPGGATAMSSQTRYGTGNGTTIAGHTSNTPATINDGAWHMFTWTFDTTSGELDSYFDGSLVDSFTSTASSFAMADAASPLGSLGLKGDNGFMLADGSEVDETWVFDGVLSQSQVGELYTGNSITPAPEPGTMALAGLGGVLLGLMSFRRRA